MLLDKTFDELVARVVYYTEGTVKRMGHDKFRSKAKQWFRAHLKTDEVSVQRVLQKLETAKITEVVAAVQKDIEIFPHLKKIRLDVNHLLRRQKREKDQALREGRPTTTATLGDLLKARHS